MIAAQLKSPEDFLKLIACCCRCRASTRHGSLVLAAASGGAAGDPLSGVLEVLLQALGAARGRRSGGRSVESSTASTAVMCCPTVRRTGARGVEMPRRPCRKECTR
ncbi:hypothetical protein GS416_09840 [Rhodococcus hoagii]|nr:hypothetical protein [Prescottella equi]